MCDLQLCAFLHIVNKFACPSPCVTGNTLGLIHCKLLLSTLHIDSVVMQRTFHTSSSLWLLNHPLRQTIWLRDYELSASGYWECTCQGLQHRGDCMGAFRFLWQRDRKHCSILRNIWLHGVQDGNLIPLINFLVPNFSENFPSLMVEGDSWYWQWLQALSVSDRFNI